MRPQTAIFNKWKIKGCVKIFFLLVSLLSISGVASGYTFELYIRDGDNLKRYKGIDHDREFLIPIRIIIRSESRSSFLININGYPLRTLGPETRRYVAFSNRHGRVAGGGNYLETGQNYDTDGHKNPFVIDTFLFVHDYTANSNKSGIPENSSLLIGFQIKQGFYHYAWGDGVDRVQAIEVIRVPNSMHAMQDVNDVSVLWDGHLRPIGDVSRSFIPTFTSDALSGVSIDVERPESEKLKEIKTFSIAQRIDLNHDGVINYNDFLIFTQFFGVRFNW